MFNSGILDVAIGILFVFTLVSTVSSAVREGLESWLKTRSSYLEYAIRELLHDRKGSAVTRAFFEHPLIHSLFQGTYCGGHGEAPTLWSPARNLPSYIPARSFAVALLDIAAHGPSNLPLGQGVLTLEALRERTVSREELPVQVRRAIVSAIDSSQGDLQHVREQLEAWYDGAMDRVSGWYKRSTQWMIFVIALGSACALNIDTIAIVDSLYHNQALRDVSVAAAGNASGNGTVQGALRELSALHLPIGWHEAPKNLLETAIGLLITALAATLGAPFWFDVLNKVMVIRGTVKPHEKSPEEGSEDRVDVSAGKRVATPAPVLAAVQSHPDNDVDACGLASEHGTPDEALPAAVGGVR